MISEGDGIHEYSEIVEIGVHKCDDTDFKKMKKPLPGGAKKINKMKDDGVLHCFDREDVNGKKLDTTLFGADDNSLHRRIEFILMPCLTYSHKHKIFNITDNVHNSSCKGSLDDYKDIKIESEKFLKNAEIVIVHNQAAFNISRFDDDMITRYSKAWSLPFTASEPSWIQAMLVENVIDDETALFNLGGDFQMEKTFNSFEIKD